ncbi:MAG: hypothetical protein HC795_06845 [Coleofasciculaceae cyanobacterium RL_1_1]|nr:hypothetical protein [Coleofasciculaceae cyanobacterium RL_1_1]
MLGGDRESGGQASPELITLANPATVASAYIPSLEPVTPPSLDATPPLDPAPTAVPPPRRSPRPWRFRYPVM